MKNDPILLEDVERPNGGRSYCHQEKPSLEKMNRCDERGDCTCVEESDEKSCLYFQKKEFLDCGIGCIMRAWGCQCLSPIAREAARGKT